MSIMALSGVNYGRDKKILGPLQVTRGELVCRHGYDERDGGDNRTDYNMQVPLAGPICVPGVGKNDYRCKDLNIFSPLM